MALEETDRKDIILVVGRFSRTQYVEPGEESAPPRLAGDGPSLAITVYRQSHNKVAGNAGGLVHDAFRFKSYHEIAVTVLGVVGDDPEGGSILKALEEKGISVSGVKRRTGASTGLTVAIENHNSKSVSRHSYKPDLDLKPEELPSSWEEICDGRPLLVVLTSELGEDTIEHFLNLAKGTGVMTLLKLSQPIAISKEMRGAITYLFINERAVSEMWPFEQDFEPSGDRDLGVLADKYLRAGAELVVINRGDKGIFFSEMEGQKNVVDLPRDNFIGQVVDDYDSDAVFVGALVVQLLRRGESSKRDMIRFAQKVAGKSILQGGKLEVPYWNEMNQ